jgi:hypothetical protein
MARKDLTPAVEEEILQKKPHHPEATIMLILSAVFLIGAISFSSSQLFGQYLTKEEDAQAMDAGKSPAQAALERVMRKDEEMKKIIQSLEGDS